MSQGSHTCRKAKERKKLVKAISKDPFYKMGQFQSLEKRLIIEGYQLEWELRTNLEED